MRPAGFARAAALRILLVDDESLARSRLRRLLLEVAPGQVEILGEAGSVPEALAFLAHAPCDVLLLDISLPGESGLQLARTLRALQRPPLIVFVSAHEMHALTAFELDACDYLLKPVRRERLAAALAKVNARLGGRQLAPTPSAPARTEYIAVPQRGGVVLVPLADILFLRAEQKYVALHTRDAEYLLEASLSQLEQEHSARFLRIHRNCLVALGALLGLARQAVPDPEAGWYVQLAGTQAMLPVSRRQLPMVREALLQRAGGRSGS